MEPKKILIVDDDDVTLKLLNSRLTSEGFEVHKARTGNEAIEMAAKIVPNLIIMDIILPDIEGSEAISIINDNPATRDVKKIVFMSSIVATDEGSTISEVTVGGSKYSAFSKPINFSDLLPVLKKALDS
ncbi:MAG: response regulator [Candidatus Omnitrophica bacterium]|nr:response regulator [Candidatus Omnitrophota bacterium]